MDSAELTLLQAARHRPVVLRDAIASKELRALWKMLAGLPSDRWAPGDGTTHSWQECFLQPGELCAIDLISPEIARFTALASRTAAWINAFGTGEWIGRHRDADGDVQVIVPLNVPAFDQGGHLWVNTRATVVPVKAGDLLLFNASVLPHGTTRIEAHGARRVTLNIRLWHSSSAA